MIEPKWEIMEYILISAVHITVIITVIVTLLTSLRKDFLDLNIEELEYVYTAYKSMKWLIYLAAFCGICSFLALIGFHYILLYYLTLALFAILLCLPVLIIWKLEKIIWNVEKGNKKDSEKQLP